jgi:hypothetical protein
VSVAAAGDWRGRQASAGEAVSAVRPGDGVFVGSACATPRTLVRALEEQRVPGVVMVHFLTDRVGAGDPPETAYRHRVFYIGADVRDLSGRSTRRWCRSRRPIPTARAASAYRWT